MAAEKRAVILLSGGLDSSTLLAIAAREGFELFALTFRYGQRHAAEIAAAKAVAKEADVREHRIIEIDLAAFGGSALTTNIPVPKDRPDEEIAGGIPVTYVPARNTIFLAYALAWAEALGARDVFIGVNALDYSGYPDCRPEFISAFQELAKVATKAAVEGAPVTIHTPLIHMTKAEIIQKGVALGVDYSLTHSCYDPAPDGSPCGHCDSCQLRKKGFEKAGIADPLA